MTPYLKNSRIWKKLIPVYLVMAVVCMAVPVLDYRVESFTPFRAFPWPFLLFAVTGFWAAKVTSKAYGVFGGGLMGLIMTGTRGFLMPMFGMPLPEEEKVKVLFIMQIGIIMGTLLGFLGGGLAVLSSKMWQRLKSTE